MSEYTRKPWIRVGRIDEIPEDQALRLDTTPPVSVFRSDGEFFCVDDTCTHEDFSLADGWVEDGAVECPLHLAKFCLRTGAALATPACRPLATHEVRVDGADVYVRIERGGDDRVDGHCPGAIGSNAGRRDAEGAGHGMA
ncbi:bifunctional 3-phenylpropionate/cinnamic acid dioxygenase ferredoxin subunit [Embleya scabrispora]|uniref:bifunctional 3-phenylpropionate/cinnamic acid dioxygenase ferredoxin subunit n=1 Tax=Embleya scabrispora TaxID=159449 RepID=UPI0003733BA3|nr:bifunctional 3-phenylpropionate/cinnamic acid dioxygenase ferredoxin subunit [Embleya scabrispora]MYS83900.1 bifunctional 3-phenylpropionate/cinnamic acid dioxygenase ferredoxin subunit [Streptomyces sp. SID5474]